MKVKNDHRSLFSNLSNWKEEAWKKTGPQRDSNLWPLRYRCDALPTELWSHTLGANSPHHWLNMLSLLIGCCCYIIIISIGNSMVSRGIWDKYREWYFKIHQNITSRRGEWYLGSFEISWAGIYPKNPEETVLFFVYTTRQRNFVFHITHEDIFLFSHAHLIGFTTTRDWL